MLDILYIIRSCLIDMKYGDLLLLIIGIVFIMTIAYTAGVNQSIWYIPLVLLVVLIFLHYELKIKK